MPWTSVPDTLGQGPQGPRGAIGGWVINDKFSDDLTPGPASGRVEFDDADIEDVEHIYIADVDRFGNDIQAVLAVFLAGDGIKILSESNERKLAFFQIVSVSEETGYWDFEVVYLSGDGGFVTSENLGIGFAREGPQGIQGDPGVDGDNGLFSIIATPTYKTDGSFSTSSTSFVDVTGASVTWTQVTAGYCKIDVVGSFGDTASPGSAHDAVLAVQVDGGTDFPLVATEEHTGGSGNDTRLKPLSCTIYFSGLSSGSHTVKIRLRTRGIAAGSAQVCATADLPLRLTVAHQ